MAVVRGAKGTMRQVEAEGLVLEVHWLTGEWSCMYKNSQQGAGQCRDSLCRYQATCLEVENWNSIVRCGMRSGI